jgi:SH3-like domain-containing protein
MRASLRLFPAFLSLFLLFIAENNLCAQENMPFTGEVNADNINIRADSTVSADIICKAAKGETLEVVSQSYNWYKIRLPKNAPSFVKKDLVARIEDKPADSFDKLKSTGEGLIKNAKVIKERVNIRLSPTEASPVLGKIGRNEVVTVLAEKGDWYKIEPVNNSFGWINAKFVNKASATAKPVTAEPQQQQAAQAKETENIVVEGLIRPYGMVFKRPATHKLITVDNKIFLLKGDKKNLDLLNYHKVRVSGKFTGPVNQKYPIIETEKIEALD